MTIKSHGGPIDIEGIAVAVVNDKLQLENVEIWMDPLAMFRQMAAQGMKLPEAQNDAKLALQKPHSNANLNKARPQLVQIRNGPSDPIDVHTHQRKWSFVLHAIQWCNQSLGVDK